MHWDPRVRIKVRATRLAKFTALVASADTASWYDVLDKHCTEGEGFYEWGREGRRRVGVAGVRVEAVFLSRDLGFVL